MLLQNLLGGRQTGGTPPFNPQQNAGVTLAGLMAPENRERTALILSSIGASLKGQNNTGQTLQSLMMMDALREKKQKEADLKKEREKFLGGMFGRQPRAAAKPPKPSLAQALGLDMGSTTPETRNTVTVDGQEYDMGTTDPWAGKEDIKRGIFAGESGGDYDALYGFSNRDGGQFSGVKVTDMTVDEALQFADPQGPYGQWVKGQIGRVATPMGGFQVVGTTLGAAKRGMGLTGNERLTPELQDQIGAWILDNQGTGAWEGYKGPQSGGVQVAQNGGWDRQTMMQILGSEAFTREEKQFMLEDWRHQQKAGRGELQVKQLADGFNYYIDPTGQQEPRRVAPNIQSPATKMSEKDKEIERMRKAYPELTDQQLVGVVDNVLRVSRDPFTDQIQIVNLATGQVTSPSFSQQNPPQETAEEPAPQPTQREPLTFGTPFQGAENAFGLEGMGRGLANSVSDFIGTGQVFPQTGQTQQDFNVLQEDLTNDMQAAYGQRVPSWLLKDIKELTPKAGGFTGPDAAKNKLISLGRRFQDELQAAQSGLAGRGRSPEMQAEARAKISSLERALQRVQSALAGFGGGQKNTTQSGVSWEVVE